MTVVVLPAGDVRTVTVADFAPSLVAALRPRVTAALEGAPVRLPGGGRLRAADVGAVVLASVTDRAGAVVLTLTLHRADPDGRAWSHLRAVRPDLPRSLPAPWCAVTTHAGPVVACLAALWAEEGSAMP